MNKNDIGSLPVLFTLLGIVVLIYFLSGCTTWQSGPYNRDLPQDPACYARYGGQLGYCDQIFGSRGRII